MDGDFNIFMPQITFAEGHVIELNNQAKHAVTNRMNRPRIHFIFDYVDESPPPRILLSPGNTVHQTRRSIDLQSDYYKRPMPRYAPIKYGIMGIGFVFVSVSPMNALLCFH